MAWIFVAGQIVFAESFPDRPTVAEREETVRLGTECVKGVNERCNATQYKTNPVTYRVSPPFVRTNEAIGWHLDPNALERMAATSRALVPWYVNLDTAFNHSPNIAMLFVADVWTDLQIGDWVSKFTITWASGTNAAIYGDYPLRVRLGYLNERYQVLNYLETTLLTVKNMGKFGRGNTQFNPPNTWGNAKALAEYDYSTSSIPPESTFHVQSYGSIGVTYVATTRRTVQSLAEVAPMLTTNLGGIEAFGKDGGGAIGGAVAPASWIFDRNEFSNLTTNGTWDLLVSTTDFQRGPIVTFMNTNALPNWCGDPALEPSLTIGRGFYLSAPLKALGYWQFNYCRDPL